VGGDPGRQSAVSDISLLWYLGWPLAGVLVGLVGLRTIVVRWFVATIPGAYAVLLFTFLSVRGGPKDCTSAGCHPTSFLSDIGLNGVFVVVFVRLLTLTPLGGAWVGVRWPSVTGAVLLVALIALNPFGFVIWVPAAAAVIGAAVAGPPRHFSAGAKGALSPR